MTVTELCDKIGGRLVLDAAGDIQSFYAGDFLSRVMGRAPAGSAWFTVMANVNVAGVAVLAEVRAVVLCEGVQPDALLTDKLKDEGIGLITTDRPVYECCAAVS